MSETNRNRRGRRSAKYVLLQAILERMSKKHAEAPADIPRMRHGLKKGLGRMGHAPASKVSVTQRSVEGVPCLEFTPARARGDAVVLYVHGGGYCLGSTEAYRGVVSRMCASLGRHMVMPEYRLAPEHPYPAGLKDLEVVAKALTPSSTEPPLVVMGDSAGGGLALALAQQMCRREDLPGPDGLVLYSPWVDLRCESPSTASGAMTDWVVRPQWLRTFAEMYAGAHSVNDPRVTPLLGDHEGLPPTLLEVGGLEVLRDDARRLRSELERAGVATTFVEDPKGIHVWQIYLPWLPEARESMARTRAFLAAHVEG